MRAGNRAAHIALAALLISGWIGAGNAESPINNLIHKKAPEFARPAFDGGRLDLADYRGKVVLLNFWATWCAPCETEMPVFAAWQRRYGAEGLQVIGISMDDDAAPARKLAKRLKLNYPAAMGDAPLGELYGGVEGLPLTMLIDRGGVVRAVFQGETSPEAMETQLRKLLRQH